MTTQHLPSDPDAPRLDRRRGTSFVTWLAIVATVATLVAVRLPQLEALARERTSGLLADLGDAELGAASVRVGAITAMLVFVVVTTVVAVVASLLERWIGPQAWAPRPWLRLGAGGLAVAVVAVGLQVAAVALALPTVDKSLAVLAIVVVTTAALPLAFGQARTWRGYLRTFAVTGAAGMLAWLQ